jgi:hypothetical protein
VARYSTPTSSGTWKSKKKWSESRKKIDIK